MERAGLIGVKVSGLLDKPRSERRLTDTGSEAAISDSELRGFLAVPRVVAVATLAKDGSPRVYPAAFVYEANRFYLAVHAGSALPDRYLGPAQVADFLDTYRYPSSNSPAHVAVATLRKDGSPFAIPLAILHDKGNFYISLNDARTMNARLRRDPRIALSSSTNSFPITAVGICGLASRVDDSAHTISKRIFTRQMSIYPSIDFDAYERDWLAVGRTVYSVKPLIVSGWDEGRTGNFAGAPLELGQDRRACVAVFNEEVPTVAVIAQGVLTLVRDEDQIVAGRIGQRYKTLPGHVVHSLVPTRIVTWDLRNRPD